MYIANCQKIDKGPGTNTRRRHRNNFLVSCAFISRGAAVATCPGISNGRPCNNTRTVVGLILTIVNLIVESSYTLITPLIQKCQFYLFDSAELHTFTRQLLVNYRNPLPRKLPQRCRGIFRFFIGLIGFHSGHYDSTLALLQPKFCFFFLICFYHSYAHNKYQELLLIL